MKNVHVIIPDLFLPRQLAAYASADLRLPALETLLSRARATPLKTHSLEECLCEHFGVDGMAIAPLTLLADGMPPGDAYWLRADPVDISIQRKQMILQPAAGLDAGEAARLCASLNAHFAVDGLRFHAPHPQRWYLQLERAPQIKTHSLPQVVGADVHAHLPYGVDALKWHSLFNEIQMLFYEHAVNRAREQRGESVVTGVWLWGGGKFAGDLPQSYARVLGDSELAAAFAQAAGIGNLICNGQLPADWAEGEGDLLLVYEGLRGALQRANIAEWRSAAQQFEKNHAEPLLAALGAGKIAQITLDVIGGDGAQRFRFNRAATWKLWRRSSPLLHYS